MLKESLSVMDMFKIGVGPSSSHTLGPWTAARRFVTKVLSAQYPVISLQVTLFGSLAKTGNGHGTDIAILLGLRDEDPVTFDLELLNSLIDQIYQQQRIDLGGKHAIAFDPLTDLVFRYDESLPRHPNGMRFVARLDNGDIISDVY
jgi:L-serine dehydratase